MLFNHHRPRGVPESTVEHLAPRTHGLVARRHYQRPLSGSQTVGLDDIGGTEASEGLLKTIAGRHRDMFGRGYAVAHHERFGPCLATLESCAVGIGTEHSDVRQRATQTPGKTLHQGGFGPDDHEGYIFRAAKPGYSIKVAGRLRLDDDTAGHPWRQSAHNSLLSAATADYQYIS